MSVNVKVEMNDDFEKALMREVEKSISEMEFDYECPECSAPMKLTVGMNKCPSCGFEFEGRLG